MADEWLSVKECAERLGKPARTVRDYAGRLAPEHKRKLDPLPMQIRYSALLAYLNPADDRPLPPEPAQEPRTADLELLVQLRSENEFLRSQVEQRSAAEGELRRLMMADKAELSRLREQLQIGAGREGETREVKRRPWWRFWR